MDIKLPVNSEILKALSRVRDHPLAAKIGQQLDAAVIRIDNTRTEITLKIENQTIQVQSNQPLPLEKGHVLKLIVNRLMPEPEFKVIDNSARTGTAPVTLMQRAALTPMKPDAGVPDKAQSNKTFGNPMEVLTARVTAVAPEKIQLQILADKTGLVSSKQLIDIPADRNSVQNLKPGQNVILEAAKPGQTREIRIRPMEPGDLQEIVKQYLPRHEAPAVLIDRLIADLPALQNSKNVSETLKNLAQEILRNLPKPEQLTDGNGLKKVVEQSGVFLEARLSSLTKLPSELQTSDFNSNGLKKVVEQSGVFPEARLSPLTKLPSELQTSDFKGLLLKLAQAFKSETSPEQEQKLSATEFERLKNLLQKTENSLAKLVLDQLASLPKDESPKQVWLLEIPFVDQNKTQSVEIEIELDKQNDAERDANPNWSVLLTVKPPQLGTLHCKLSYIDNKINTHFWAERQEVTDLIERNLGHLKKQFETEGLTPGFIATLDGTPSHRKSSLFIDKNLVSEKV